MKVDEGRVGCAKAIGLLLLVILVIPLNVILCGIVLRFLWGWFVVPTFELPSLGLVPAMGLATLISFVVYRDLDAERPKRSTEALVGKVIGTTVMIPLSFLGVGWVIHLFM